MEKSSALQAAMRRCFLDERATAAQASYAAAMRGIKELYEYVQLPKVIAKAMELGLPGHTIFTIMALYLAPRMLNEDRRDSPTHTPATRIAS